MSGSIGGDLLQAAFQVFKSFKTGGKKVEQAQLANIVGVYEQYGSVDMVKLYVIRQVGRGKISREAAKTLIEKLERGYSDRLIELIGLVRWFYDAVKDRKIDLTQVNTYEEFVSKFVKGSGVP